MKIGFIGAGNIGANAARLFVNAGHEVAISNSRGAESLADLANEIGAVATDIAGAADFGDVVFISIPFGKYASLPSEIFNEKVVIDSNNYYPGRDGNYIAIDNGSTTSSELVAGRLAGAKVVKAFNTIWFEHLRTEGDISKPMADRRVIFVSGDDAGAKKVVEGLITDIGFAAYDLGGLKDGGRRQQTDSPIYNKSINVAQASEILAA